MIARNNVLAVLAPTFLLLSAALDSQADHEFPALSAVMRNTRRRVAMVASWVLVWAVAELVQVLALKVGLYVDSRIVRRVAWAVAWPVIKHVRERRRPAAAFKKLPPDS